MASIAFMASRTFTHLHDTQRSPEILRFRDLGDTHWFLDEISGDVVFDLTTFGGGDGTMFEPLSEAGTRAILEIIAL